MPSAGRLRKMQARVGAPIEYALPVGEDLVPLNPAIGHTVRLEFLGRIECVACGRTTRKSFGQGYCYPCFTGLARCDRCVVHPELCHYAAGTCREPEWGEQHCLIPHTVYLANSSGLKVGITRGLDARGRWIDQGAAQAIPIRIVADRLEAGRAEVALKPFVADKTNWRRMLSGEPPALDLRHERDRLLGELSDRGEGEADGTLPGHPAHEDVEVTHLTYPVAEYPSRIVSHNLDKAHRLEGTLQGIKGQYLILDTAVVNVRKYGGYVVRFEV